MARGRAAATTSEVREADGATETPDRNRPVHSVRLRNIRAAIWSNEGEQGTRYNATFCRLYKDNEGFWRSTDSFGRDDLLLLAKVADMAHSWIAEAMQAHDQPF
ncbi:MAG: hypothetical protein KatS3mg108_2560 [Isosphaeraceae bacterium]|jgi:hypothetical protein|nr:MAG: hypothetical protein KatS3mg108_2560 [Isosphaeraceae bacterium]